MSEPVTATGRRATEGCMVCGAALLYESSPTTQTCFYCGRSDTSAMRCPAGHYVCDACHAASTADLVRRLLESASETDPGALLERVMALPGLPMHGPEHHAVVPGVLVVAARNAGFAVPADALDTALRRGARVPGGWCGYCGACGAAVGAGIAVSALTGATPLKGEQRTLALGATAHALEPMLDGQPRCCKRASRLAIAAAVEFLRERLAIDLPAPAAVVCSSSQRNKECAGAACRYHP